MTPSAASLNLAKNLVGSGALSLPAGVAAFSSGATALGPALAMLMVAALLGAYSFFLVGQVCEDTKAQTFGSAWRQSVRKASWLPLVVCILECLGGSVVYAMVLGDVFSSLLRGAPFLPAALTSRTGVIVGLVAPVLYPLCCLRSFAALARFSLMGTIATTYAVAFVALRYFDGSYGPGGIFFDRAIHPVLIAGSGWFNSKMLILVSILSTAFLVHFNAPQMYAELETPKGVEGAEAQRKAKISSFGRVALAGFGIASMQYALIMVFGFLTFGRATQGNVLLNYSSKDRLAAAAQFAVGVSTLFGYPMQFAGLRAGLLEASGRTPSDGGGTGGLSTAGHRLLTAALLAGNIAIACAFHDLGKFQALEGALLAAFLVYVAPPLMALCLRPAAGQAPRSEVSKARLVGLIVLGLALGGIGGAVTAGS